MRFFIPDLRADPAAAERKWRHYLEVSGAPADSRRVYKLSYSHNGGRFVVVVGEERAEYKRRTGPRGGYIKDAGQMPYPVRTGTVVSGIVDAGHVFYVWSYGPPFGGWANPSLVGRNEAVEVVYFDDDPAAG